MDFDTLKDNKTKIIIGIVILGFILIFATPAGRLSILPSFEGMNAGVEGFSYPSSYGDNFVRIDAKPPSPYKWVSQDPKSAILSFTSYSLGLPREAQVRAEVNNPQVVSDPFTTNKQIHYWVKVSDNNFVEVEGQINTYNLGLSVSAVNLPGLDTWFQGEKVWFALTGVTWNNAYQLQTQALAKGAVYSQAWEAPLAVIITNYDESDLGNHYKLDPSEGGRWFTLYSTPQQVGTVSDLGLQVGGDFNQTLTGNTSPDSRLVRSGFFAITLTDFGTTEHLIYSNAPVAHYTIKVYTIQLGKYTYTNPDNTPFKERKSEGDDPFKGIKDWFANPFNLTGLGIFGLAAIGIVTAVALFWFFGRPKGV